MKLIVFFVMLDKKISKFNNIFKKNFISSYIIVCLFFIIKSFIFLLFLFNVLKKLFLEITATCKLFFNYILLKVNSWFISLYIKK